MEQEINENGNNKDSNIFQKIKTAFTNNDKHIIEIIIGCTLLVLPLILFLANARFDYYHGHWHYLKYEDIRYGDYHLFNNGMQGIVVGMIALCGAYLLRKFSFYKSISFIRVFSIIEYFIAIWIYIDFKFITEYPKESAVDYQFGGLGIAMLFVAATLLLIPKKEK